jgi:glycosyltransferase involved in cell wall biosynthesis
VTAHPRVTAVIPLYNGERHIRAAIESVLAQTLPPQEVIVVDDGSTDRGPSILAGIPQVTLLRQANCGPGPARNAGILASSGDFVAFLDQDDLWTSEKLRIQVEHLLINERLGFVLAWQRHVIEDGMRPPAWFRQELVNTESPCMGPGTLLARRRLFDEFGLFDPSYRTASDGEWMLRLGDLGVEYATLPDVLLIRRIHDTNQSANVPVVHAEMLRLVQASLARRRLRSGG